MQEDKFRHLCGLPRPLPGGRMLRQLVRVHDGCPRRRQLRGGGGHRRRRGGDFQKISPAWARISWVPQQTTGCSSKQLAEKKEERKNVFQKVCEEQTPLRKSTRKQKELGGFERGSWGAMCYGVPCAMKYPLWAFDDYPPQTQPPPREGEVENAQPPASP